MSEVIHLTPLRLARLKARAEAQEYALVETAEGFDLRCPFNGRPQVSFTDLAEVERFLSSSRA